VSVASSLSLHPWLEELERAVALGRAADEADDVHRLRSALARIDVWLRMAGMRVLRDDLGDLRRCAARCRDLDVFLARVQRPPIVAWARAQRAHAIAALRERLSSPQTTALVAALGHIPLLERKRARRFAERQRARARRRLARALRRRASADDWHALRRALRRLRFAREWLGRDGRPLARLQDELGALNDAVVALELLCECPVAAQSDRPRAALQGRIAQRMRRLRRTCRGAARSH
jgi:CHAD domain-containing protein